MYYLRVRVPVDLREVIGRNDIKQTLRTKNHREAKTITRLKSAEIEKAFLKLRAGKETMSDSQLKRLADKLLAEILNKTEKARQHGLDVFELPLDDFPEGYDFGNGTSYAGLHVLDATLSPQRTDARINLAARVLENRVKELRKELKLGNYSEHTRKVAKRRAEMEGIPTPPVSWFLHSGEEQAHDESEGVPLDMIPEEQRAKILKKAKKLQEPVQSTWDEKPAPEFAAVLRTVALTLLEGYEIEIERIGSEYNTDLQLKAETRLMHAAKSYTLNALWESYRGRKTTEKRWTDTTKEKYEGFIAAINRTLGEDFDFSIFEDTDRVTELIEKLRGYKSIRTKNKWSDATLNDCIVFLSTLHKYAITNRKFGITYNPFTSRQVVETGSKKKIPFTPDELSRMKTALEVLKVKEPDKYWVMYLMLYTGARVSEVSQLRLDDIDKIGTHWIITYQDRPELEQTIKLAIFQKARLCSLLIKRLYP